MVMGLKAVLAATLLLSTASYTVHAETLVGYISPIAAQPGQQLINLAIEQAAKEKGWTYRVLDANLSPDRQVSHIDTLLTLGAKAIGTWSLDNNAVAGAYSRAKAQNVPIIGLISVGPDVTNTVYWDPNLCKPGGPFDREAQWIAKRKPGAKVIIFGGPPVESIVNNTNCFTAAAKAAGLKVLDRVDNTKDSTASAATLAADKLTRFPDVQVFWAYNDSTALGISASAIAAGRTIHDGKNEDGLLIFGMNGDDDAILAVKEGRLTGTIDTDAYATGFAMALAMERAMADPTGKQQPIVVASKLFTYENVNTWKPGPDRGYSLENFPVAR